ncbi:unnamed protein product [Cunninghamella blakesleeana]
MTKIELHAYTIPLLHAAKYPASEICGLLLGKVDNELITSITTAIPLFHHWTTLTPMLDLALEQVELYAEKKQLQIVGWYQANERINDKALHDNGLKVVEAIRQRYKAAVAFIVDNEKISSLENKSSAIVVYNYIEQQWKVNKQAIQDINEDFYPKVRGYFSASTYQRIIDLDDHLENIDLDYLSSSEIKL